MNNINSIGCKWRFNYTCEYIELDIHNSNFHPGTTKRTSTEYCKIMHRNDGARYIRHGRKTWYID